VKKNMDGNFNNRQNDRRFGEKRHNTLPPVRVGEEIDVTIEAVGEKGDGICKKQGFILFVPETVEGDRVRIKITKILHKVGFARVIGPAQTQEEAPQQTKQTKPEYVTEQQVKAQPSVPAPEDSEDFGDDSEENDEISDEKEELSLAQEVGDEVAQGIKDYEKENDSDIPQDSDDTDEINIDEDEVPVPENDEIKDADESESEEKEDLDKKE
jgi:predicted RNA-binding protein with TRAM domain